MRNKRLIWMLGILILVVSSMVTALSNPFRGISGRIGGTMGFIVIPVNAAIIGLLLYLLSAVVQFPKLGSKPGKIVFVVVLVILSAYLAFNISYSPEGKYQFIWSKPVVGEVMHYLINSGADGKAIGILRPSRILIFAGASLIFSWFFVGFLQIGGGKYNKADYLLAILIAAEATRAGMSKGMLIFVGQIIAIFMFYKQFSKVGGRHWFVSIAWAYVLQSLVVRALFKPADMIWSSWFLTRIGFPRTFRGMIYFILGLLLALPALAAIGWIGGKEKEAKEKEKEKRWKEDIVSYPVAYLKRWLGKVRNPIVRWLYKKWDPKITTPEDKIPFPFRDLRVEFMTLMNYMLRLEVYKAKKNYVTQTQQFLDDEIYGEKGLHQVVQVNRINNYLNMLKNGFGFKLNNKGEFEPIIEKIINEKGEEEKLEAGFNSTEWFIYELINNLKREVEGFTFIKNMDRAGWIENQLNKRMHRIDKYLISVKKRWGCEKFDSDTGRFTAFAMRKGAYNLLEGRRILILDQYRRHGRYDHFYRFAKDGAQIYKVGLIDQGLNPKNSVMRKYPEFGTVSNGGKVPGEFKFEVDTNGYFLDDLSEYIVEGINRDYIRKVDPKDVVEYDLFNDATKWLEAEWDFYVWDVRDGRYHPNSRSTKDYADLHALRSFNYSDVKPHSGPIERKNPAFDRQALLDPAFDYIGRKNMRGVREVDVSKANIKPCISTLGMKRYILSYLETKMKVDERFRYNLSRYVYDTGSEKEEVDVFTRAPKTEATEGKK